MNVACMQLDLAWENREANFAKVRSLLSTTVLSQRTLLVLPEMFPTGFSLNSEITAESDPSPTEIFYQETSRQHRLFLLGGLVKQESAGCQNQAVLCSPEGKLISRYAKIHPFTLGGESKKHVPGRELIVTACGEFQLASFVCYDLRFPELFRGSVRRGANLMVVIASWPSAREEHWITLLKARAIENLSYVVGVNRCGTDPNFSYPGRSLVVAPSGEVLLDAGGGEGLFLCSIDLEALQQYRAKLPFLQDLKEDWVK